MPCSINFSAAAILSAAVTVFFELVEELSFVELLDEELAPLLPQAARLNTVAKAAVPTIAFLKKLLFILFPPLSCHIIPFLTQSNIVDRKEKGA